jgi:hypothetical protein
MRARLALHAVLATATLATALWLSLLAQAA